MVLIKGWQKTSLIDFSPYTASVIFTGGCNFRCPFCHNPELVLHFNAIEDIDEKEVLGYLELKKNWIDGVCITGGEPTIYPDLPEFISKIRKIGTRVKLDTNGSNPDMLKELIKKKLIDYIAMDIKSDLDNYSKIAGVNVDITNIKQSINLIRNSGIDHEFRTTVIPGLVGKKEVFKIGKLLKGSKKYVIQNFRGTKPVIGKELQGLKSYSKEELGDMKEIVKDYFDDVEIRD